MTMTVSPPLPAEPLGRAVGATATLSFVAGFVDVVGFIALFGLFTAHVTGNFVVIGLELVKASEVAIAKVLALPTFVVMVVVTRLAVLHYEIKGKSPWLGMLLAQAALLGCFMLAGVASAPHAGPNDPGPVVAGLLGIAAMAVQNAGSKLILHNHAPTTLMTGNTTEAVIDFVDMYRDRPERRGEARERLKRVAPSIVAFAAGTILGAYAYVTFSYWCLAIPIVALLGVAWMIAMRVRASGELLKT